MTREQVDAVASVTGARELVAWVEANLAGTVVGLEKLSRWRVGWFVDLEREGQILQLYARGARGPDFPSPYDLDHELRVHRMLEDHGFPVPHAYALVELDSVQALVMDRLAGEQGLLSAPDDQTRRRLMLECVDHMARMHAIDTDELASRGFEVPSTQEAIVWSGAIARLEQHYLASDHPPDPVIEFLRRWLCRNAPKGRTKASFVTWDAAQFLHHDGVLTGLIDFELAHVGDPYMDLAPLRSRDTMEPFGDLSGAFARYEQVTGEPVDMDVVRYFEVAQLTATLMLQRPVLLAPDEDSDLVTHIVWFVESARYAFDVLAELLGLSLEIIEPVSAPASSNAVAHAHLVASLHRASRVQPGDESASPIDAARRWRARCDYRLARHLQRVEQVGGVVERAELADITAMVGRGVSSRGEADARLVELIAHEDPALDSVLVQHLNRRMQRASSLLGPPDALLVQHVSLQPLPR